jgi:hypothetical protein
MGPDHGGVDGYHPFRLVQVAATLHPTEHTCPGALSGPPPMPVLDRLPVAVGGRQVPPGRARPRTPEHSVDDLPVVHPLTAAPRRTVRQQRVQESPLVIAQVMTIVYRTDLHDPDRNHSRDTL